MLQRRQSNLHLDLGNLYFFTWKKSYQRSFYFFFKWRNKMSQNIWKNVKFLINNNNNSFLDCKINYYAIKTLRNILWLRVKRTNRIFLYLKSSNSIFTRKNERQCQHLNSIWKSNNGKNNLCIIPDEVIKRERFMIKLF